MEKEFTYSKHWMRHNVISTVKGNISINFIMFLYKVRNDILENHKIFNINECMTNVTLVSVDDFLKWKKMYDYMDNYKKLECTFQKKQECEEYCNEACNDDYKENYCKYFVDIINIYTEFKHVCTVRGKEKCPEF
ncbi:PIR Superfamily Protein [Plasmodium ovale wallikeri]|uniref:PIR Superfamily Protein n=1 Tax=Plasmodium ovale wallikeri TaxID=864142 RepID=A0A1A8YUH2_PLAOA|nr:PIR Superfamily Protein [Plasmodium ovale wallikeri]